MQAGHDQVFVIRVWCEPKTGEYAQAMQRRARIRYVNDRREHHANSLEEAFQIVRSIVAESDCGQES
jgi:hypothetical protein